MPTAAHELASVLDALSTRDAPQTAHAELAEQFDAVYRKADGDPALIPWQRRGPNPPLVAWLNTDAHALVRPGACVVVVGCGLGDDVAEIASRGYDVVGFDICPSAIAWAKRRHPDLADSFLVADAIAPSNTLQRRFDLVVEIDTLQTLPVAMRTDAAAGIASLIRPHGTLLTICRGRDDDEPIDQSIDPPYPLSPTELLTLMEANGLAPTRPLDDFFDDEDPPVRRLRAASRHV